MTDTYGMEPEKKPATLLTACTSVETVCLNHWSVEALFTPQVSRVSSLVFEDDSASLSQASMLWKSLDPGYTKLNHSVPSIDTLKECHP